MRTIELVEAGPSRLADLEALFETSEQCRECGCMNHHSRPGSAPTGPAATARLGELLAEGRASGVLAYVSGRCAGWCAVDPVTELAGHDCTIGDAALLSPDVWAIHCLYVAPDARGMGLSRELVREATLVARRRGARRVLAWPIPIESRGRFPEHDAEFSGRLSTYLGLGFLESRRINDFYCEVALELGPARA